MCSILVVVVGDDVKWLELDMNSGCLSTNGVQLGDKGTELLFTFFLTNGVGILPNIINPSLSSDVSTNGPSAITYIWMMKIKINRTIVVNWVITSEI